MIWREPPEPPLRFASPELLYARPFRPPCRVWDAGSIDLVEHSPESARPINRRWSPLARLCPRSPTRFDSRHRKERLPLKVQLVALALLLSLAQNVSFAAALSDSPAAVASTAGPAVAYTAVTGESTARYRVGERLVNIPLPVEAVGVTQDVSGTVYFDKTGQPAAESVVRVELGSLRSDQSRRDNFVRNNVLQVRQYPQAVFVPTEIRGMPWPVPESGQADITIVGQLTIRDVTREVEWTGQAAFDGETMRITAATSVTFDDFNLSQPRVPIVLSVDEVIRLEADIVLQRTGDA
ncbi:MAG: YceI family protein [Firmicutes bacterium]|nr:YceI family protein [Bacillota bacterium]